MAKLSSLREKSFQIGFMFSLLEENLNIHVTYKTLYVLKSKAGGQLKCKGRFNGDLYEQMEMRALTVNRLKNQTRRCFSKGTLAIHLGDLLPSKFHVELAKTTSSQFKVYLKKFKLERAFQK